MFEFRQKGPNLIFELESVRQNSSYMIRYDQILVQTSLCREVGFEISNHTSRQKDDLSGVSAIQHEKIHDFPKHHRFSVEFGVKS